LLASRGSFVVGNEFSLLDLVMFEALGFSRFQFNITYLILKESS